MERFIKLTADGSHTLYIPELDEHYHSINGAIQESKHIFIDAAFSNIHHESIHIFEVGFGTGLNAYLTLLQNIDSNKKILYTTVEKHPLDLETISKLNYSTQRQDTYLKLHEAEWNQKVAIEPNFTLHKIHGDMTNLDFNDCSQNFDLIYFDAFAPEKQPEVWDIRIFERIFEKSNNNAILTTYCAKGSVRRMLETVGFSVERLKGPPGKREMLRATKKL